uniref:U2A'/phosphoprotein 32 family A C-terminal domain-containing protein n=1 Tax=Hemiselmis andersenii TaxID=464988 RepID=A0A6T8P7S5_HEMAN
METRITHSLIKAVSGEFDLENVSKLALCRMNIRKIECLQECANLQELNLSGNDITKIEGLERLHHLRKLILTTNQIENLSGLEKCTQLEHLQVQDNKISSIAEIESLLPLKNLKSVYFKNVDGTQKNLLCDHPSYRSSIMRQLPQLTVMDGERLKHSDSIYSEVPQSAGAPAKVVLPASKRWLQDWDWGDTEEIDVDKLLGQSQAKFESVLQESKKLNQAAVSLLAHYQ